MCRLALCLLLLAAGPANVAAQDDPWGMGLDAISRRGSEKYAQILRLDADQKEAAGMLFEGYMEGLRETTKSFQASMESMQSKMQEGDFSAYQKEMPALMKKYQESMERLQTGFFDDLRSLLTDAQAERWPKLERYRRREELMQYGFISGAAADLVAIADRLKLDPESNPTLAEPFEQYEVDVDKPLLALKQATEEMQEQQMEAMEDFDPGNPADMMEQAQKMMEILMGHARTVRDINRQHERLIVALLPPEQAAEFRREFNVRSFPSVYRKSHATKAIAAAEKFGDLTEEQRQALAGVRSAYERDAAPLNDKWANEIEKKDNSSAGGVFDQMWMGGMNDDDDPVTLARKSRRELDDQTRDRVVAILTEDQRARLPEKGHVPDNPWEQFQPYEEEEDEEPGQ
jgi:hypothetical protein